MENKTSRYFKYAIGEIVLVVIGILIALQINTWNIERNNSKQEKQILNQLQEEFKANLVELNSKISLRNDMVRVSEIMVDYFDNGINNVSLDSLSKYVSIITLSPTFNPSKGVTNELLNSGKLYLIKDQELKSLLTNWFGDIEKLIEMENILLHSVLNDFVPYMLKNYDQRSMYFNESESAEEVNNKFSIGIAKKPDYKGKLEKEVFDAFFKDRYIENLVTSNGYYAYLGNRQSDGIRKRIETILKIIEKELK